MIELIVSASALLEVRVGQPSEVFACNWYMHHDGCNILQEDPYSGLIGDSWRSPAEKAQFRLELQRMVTVSAVP